MHISEYLPTKIKKETESLLEAMYRPAASRRPRLTLRHLNKLKKFREMRAIEKEKRYAAMPAIYWAEEEKKNKENKDKKDSSQTKVNKTAIQSIKAKAKRKRALSKDALRQIKKELPGFRT